MDLLSVSRLERPCACPRPASNNIDRINASHRAVLGVVFAEVHYRHNSINPTGPQPDPG